MNAQHVLLASDLLSSSRCALAHAAAMALALDARVTILHVDEVAAMGFHGSAELVDYFERIVQQRDARLEDGRHWIEAQGVEEVSVEVVAGTPRVQILEYARTKGVDLIVMAKHGRRGFEKLLIGAASRRVVRGAQVPVLVVYGPEGNEAALEGPATYRRIMTATDFSEDSDRGLKITVDLARKLDATVDIAHVIQAPLVLPGWPGDPAALFPREAQAALESQRAARLKEKMGHIDVECRTLCAFGHVPDTLVDLAKDNGADMIVIPSHGHGALRTMLFGSTTEAVLELAPLPVLILPHAHLLMRFGPLGASKDL